MVRVRELKIQFEHWPCILVIARRLALHTPCYEFHLLSAAVARLAPAGKTCGEATPISSGTSAVPMTTGSDLKDYCLVRALAAVLIRILRRQRVRRVPEPAPTVNRW